MGAQFERIVTIAGIARRCFGACEWNNRIIIAGGLSTAGAYLNDVWESVDGIQWNRLSTGANSFSAREGLSLFVHDNRLYVVMGYNGTDYFSDVWMSMDGTKWDRVANNAYTARDDGAAFSLNGRIFITGGDDSASTGTTFSDVWMSPDGTTWSRILNGYTRIQRTVPSYCLFNNRMHMIGGYDGSNRLATATMSPDGYNWDVTPDTCGLPTFDDAAATVFDNKIVVTGGYTLRAGAVGGSTAMYYSFDGEKYQCGLSNMGFTIYQHKMVALKNPHRLFVLFGYTGTAVRTDIWRSTGNWQDNNS